MQPVARPQLYDAVRSVGELVGELVHALRNPVSALTTSLELLTRGLAAQEDVPQLHQVMTNEITKLNAMLGRCRDLMQLSSLELAPRELTRFLRVRLESRSEDLAARGVALSVALPDAQVEIMADESQLGNVLDALISNAVEAMRSGGTLSATLTLNAATREAVLSLRDTGEGISSATLPNVFRVLFSTKKGATGMGLPVARQVLLAHGGTISLESEPGKGTTVTMRLPLRT